MCFHPPTHNTLHKKHGKDYDWIVKIQTSTTTKWSWEVGIGYKTLIYNTRDGGYETSMVILWNPNQKLIANQGTIVEQVVNRVNTL
jgi:hypothetical protein